MELNVGPLLFNWPADAWSDFYARLADEAPVDRVILGELVCSKRLPFYADRIPQAIERLERGGKQVVLTSLALVTLPRERRAAAALLAPDGIEVEINDLTLMRWVEPGWRFSIGPLVNVYNESTLRYLAGQGARAICLPPELPFASVEILGKAAGAAGIGLEIWAFGRVPLAISARCYHARIHGLTKDSCQFVCDRDPDGLDVKTLDAQSFLTVNGVQTLSHNCTNLAGDLPRLAEAGVTALRLSPHSGDFVGVTRVFRAAAEGRITAPEAKARLSCLIPPMPLSRGFLFGDRGAA
ncbi:MAG: U32 family peptidase [Hyphomicrobiales bacterium]|nr:U32 family peptidase [Hyphomicrobiales bacterium]